MSESHALNFDAFWRELKGEKAETPPLTIEVLGKAYPLPDALPATFVLSLIRRGHEGAKSQADYLALLDKLFGEGVAEEWAEGGLTMDQIVHAAIVAEAMIEGATPEEMMKRAATAREGKAKKKSKAA